MRFVSTRGRAPELGFADVLLAGLASDGGLYVPAEWPALPDLDGLRSYADVAAAVMAPFVGDDIDADVFRATCHQAYATFDHDAVVPLVQIVADPARPHQAVRVEVDRRVRRVEGASFRGSVHAPLSRGIGPGATGQRARGPS